MKGNYIHKVTQHNLFVHTVQAELQRLGCYPYNLISCINIDTILSRLELGNIYARYSKTFSLHLILSPAPY